MSWWDLVRKDVSLRNYGTMVTAGLGGAASGFATGGGIGAIVGAVVAETGAGTNIINQRISEYNQALAEERARALNPQGDDLLPQDALDELNKSVIRNSNINVTGFEYKKYIFVFVILFVIVLVIK